MPGRGPGVRWHPGRGGDTSYRVRLLSAAGEALSALLSPAELEEEINKSRQRELPRSAENIFAVLLNGDFMLD